MHYFSYNLSTETGILALKTPWKRHWNTTSVKLFPKV